MSPADRGSLRVMLREFDGSGAPPEQRPVLERISPELRRTLGVFATPHGPKDALPASEAESFGDGGPPAWLGVNPARLNGPGSCRARTRCPAGVCGPSRSA